MPEHEIDRRKDALNALLVEAADEIAWLHREYIRKSALPRSEGVGRIIRLLQTIERQTGHTTDSPYLLDTGGDHVQQIRMTLTARTNGCSVFKHEEFKTVGELIDQLSHYPRDKELGFRNQPRQALHEVHHEDGVHLCFQ